MPITVPQPSTPISAESFGQPVANQLNATGLGVVAEVFSVVNTTNMQADVVTDLAGASVTFTAVANRRYRVTFGSAIQPSVANLWVMLMVRSGTGTELASAMVPTSSYPTFQHTVQGIAFFDKKHLPLAAGSVTLKLGVIPIGGTASTILRDREPNFIVVEDIGIDP